ncbi:MAG: DUF7490 domain-containing protein [Halobacteriota archaeon]
MPRERLLAASAAGVLAIALLVAAVVPGVLADPSEELVRPGSVDIADVAIAPETVSGQTAELRVETRLEHYGNPTENVTVEVRAIDTESGFVETARVVDLGTLSEERETPVNVTMTVEREGGYRIETIVYSDGRRLSAGSREVRGLDGLTPEYARTTVSFADVGSLPSVSYSIAEAGSNRTTLALSASLTNGGDAPSEDLEVTFVLRQAESNIVAARQSAPVGDIRPGRTETVDAEVSVPSEYNYYIDAILWKDGVVVDTAQSAANLDPTRTLSVNETETEVELRVSDFESEDDRRAREQPTTEPTGMEAPGFGVGVSVVALLGTALLARRWTR